MTKDIISKIIYKHYVALGRAVSINKESIGFIMSKEEIKELHGITILAYFYLTGEELPEKIEKEKNNGLPKN